MNISSKKLIFVTGKGGVGKSVCAAALAWNEARKGRKVCLVELGHQSFYESFFETRGINYEPSEIVSDVHIALYSAENCLKEYALHFLKVPKLYDIIFQNKVVKAFMNASPAVSEFSILGKLTSEIRGVFREEYDLYVVDCYSTGHALALFRAPKGMNALIRVGPLAEQARDIAEVISNPKHTHYVLVTLPEEMPVTETEELYGHLKSEFNAEVTLICNKIIKSPLTRKEQDDLLGKIKDKNMAEFLEFLRYKTDQQEMQWKRLSLLQGDISGVPLILNATRGQQYVEEFSSYLEKQWTLTSS